MFFPEELVSPEEVISFLEGLGYVHGTTLYTIAKVWHFAPTDHGNNFTQTEAIVISAVDLQAVFDATRGSTLMCRHYLYRRTREDHEDLLAEVTALSRQLRSEGKNQKVDCDLMEILFMIEWSHTRKKEDWTPVVSRTANFLVEAINAIGRENVESYLKRRRNGQNHTHAIENAKKAAAKLTEQQAVREAA